MAQVGSKRVEDKRPVTYMYSRNHDIRGISSSWKTERCHPSYSFPDGYDVWHTPDHWASGSTVMRYYQRCYSYVQKVKKEKSFQTDHHALVIYDVFKGHFVEGVDTVLEENKLSVISIVVPSNCIDRLQPLDLSVNKPMKDHLPTCLLSKVVYQLSKGTKAEDIKVDTQLYILKDMQAQWIVAACDHIRSSRVIAVN